MADERKGDRLWLLLCTLTGIAVDVTLNKYSSVLPGLAVVGIWAILAILFVIWFVRVETTKRWVQTRFLDHPVSYVLMFLILIPFGWGATAAMFAKLHNSPKSKGLQTSQSIQDYPPSNSLQTSAQIATERGTVSSIPLPTEPSFIGRTKFFRPVSSPQKPTVAVSAPMASTAPPTYGSQTCTGGACTQGPNSSATYNQFGAQKLFMNDEQADIIRQAMTPYAGMKVEVQCQSATDVTPFVDKLKAALQAAGLVFATNGGCSLLLTHGGTPLPDGLSFAFSVDRSDAINALVSAMRSAGVVNKQLTGFTSNVPGTFVIVVTPNR